MTNQCFLYQHEYLHIYVNASNFHSPRMQLNVARKLDMMYAQRMKNVTDLPTAHEVVRPGSSAPMTMYTSKKLTLDQKPRVQHSPP